MFYFIVVYHNKKSADSYVVLSFSLQNTSNLFMWNFIICNNCCTKWNFCFK